MCAWRRFSLALVAAAAAAVAGAKPVQFGCSYYPEQWDESRWEQDVADMRDMGLELIRLGEFNWIGFEPREGQFDFEPYRRFLTICRRHGMKVILCTPTAALPPWIHANHPDAEKRDSNGFQPPLGTRQIRCPSSPTFRRLARRITEKMAEAYRDFPNVVCWQLDNELHITAGRDPCCCPACQREFREWLKKRYGSLDALNRAWNSTFWSSTFGSWEEIRLPIAKDRHSWQVEYARFQSDMYLDFAFEQRDIVRRRFPYAAVMSNGSEMSGWMRLDTLYGGLGSVATDTYMCIGGLSRSYWMWGLSRGLTGRQRPFMIAETGPTGSEFDRGDGIDDLRAWLKSAVAHGADRIVFWRWRQPVAGEEHHPSVIPWNGRKGRTYAQLKALLRELSPSATMPASRLAILHSNESDQDTLARFGNIQFGPYENLHIRLNETLEGMGILPDYLLSGPGVDFAGYETVLVPLNTIVPKSVQAKLKDYVQGGGTVVALCRLNCVDPMGSSYVKESYPVGMTDLFGLEIGDQRIDPGTDRAMDLVEPTACEVIERFDRDAFAGEPLLTLNRYGKGKAYYFAKIPTPAEIERLVRRTFGLTSPGAFRGNAPTHSSQPAK